MVKMVDMEAKLCPHLANNAIIAIFWSIKNKCVKTLCMCQYLLVTLGTSQIDTPLNVHIMLIKYVYLLYECCCLVTICHVWNDEMDVSKNVYFAAECFHSDC